MGGWARGGEDECFLQRDQVANPTNHEAEGRNCMAVVPLWFMM